MTAPDVSLSAGSSQGVAVSGDRVTFDNDSPTSLNFSLPITNDELAEGNEGFQVTLANPTSVGGGRAQIASGGVSTTIAASEEIVFTISADTSAATQIASH